jgi:xanthine dehydrogenase molybdopterin binding subunit
MKIFHESAAYHVSGKAVYIDDIQVSDQILNGYLYTSPYAHAKILKFDLSEARKTKGVSAILSYRDLPGENQMGPIVHDEPVLAEKSVEFIGQAIFLIAAQTEEAALEAKKKISIEFEELPAVTTLKQGIEQNSFLQAQRKIEIGNTEKALKETKNTLSGEIEIGGQEHWYLETQVCLCVPGEGMEMKAYASTQNPAETQAIIAEVLGVSKHQIEVETRRLGGAFGGKETQGNHVAAWAAVLANHTKRPVKVRLQRDEDQKITGKRHPFLIKYTAGYNDEGLIEAVDLELFANAGYATDLTMAVLERAMMHAENAYFIPNMRIIGKPVKTNLPSNTAFRGFGGPQGMIGIETIIDIVARKLQKDSAEIRFKNLYGIHDKNITPYGQKVENNRLFMLYEQLVKSSEYQMRRKDVERYNAQNEFSKRGLAMTPVKFGISFTTAFLNQAGALVNLYTDGSVLLNHGGVEMGQGLHTKMQQIAALEFGIDIDLVKVNATNTSKVPNTSPTAASSGTDLNGMAVKIAVDKLKARLAKVAVKKLAELQQGLNFVEEDIVFEKNAVFSSKYSDLKIGFQQIVNAAWLERESLSATGFYSTPGVHFDRTEGKGQPFFYFAFGMAVTEVEIDVLTGQHHVLRADILHDAGESLNRSIDIGQVEGAYVQGLGWVTSEEMKYDTKGNLLNHSPDTYKIPGVRDIPQIFNVKLLEGAPNPTTIRKSKAVGEPPFMLAISAYMALRDAVSAVGNHKFEPDLQLPATNEWIVLACRKLRNMLMC